MIEYRRARWLLISLMSGCRAQNVEPRQEPRPAVVARPTASERPGALARESSRTVPRPVPNPLVSRHKPAFAHSLAEFAEAKPINDGVFGTFQGAFRAGRPTPERPAWAAIQVGTGYRRVLLVWSESASNDYDSTTYGSPADYSVQVSADSKNGVDGVWKTVASVQSNRFHSRGHSFDFTAQSWVKLVLTRAPKESPGGVSLDEIEVFDLSEGGTDTWFFAGDSITAQAFDRGTEDRGPSFDELVHRAAPRYRPAVINGGIGFATTASALEHIDEWLAINPDFAYWALGYGTNDSSGNHESERFAQSLQALIDKIRTAGRIPIVARIPFASDDGHASIPMFNQVVDRLTAANRLLPGPDLYAWFRQHPEQLRDKLHPDHVGAAAINRLWWEAIRGLYLPER